PAVDPDPLVEPAQVRGGVESGPKARGAEDRCEGRGGRSLPVCARDQDRWERAIRTPRLFTQALDPGQAGAHAAPLEAVQVLEAPAKRDAFRKAHSSTRTSRPGERAGGFAGVFAAGVGAAAGAGVFAAGAGVFAAGAGAGAAAAGVPPFGLASGRSIVRVPATTPSAPGAGGSGGSAVPIGSDAARNRS